jgi:DNA repair protein RecO
MHHIYHTEGLILGSKNYGETGKCYFIFTRELGMVYASAQGVRKMSSKLRFVLRDFGHIRVDLIRGKDFWRLTSASKTNQLENLEKNKEKLAILVNISNLLRRLLAGEEGDEFLFDDLLNGLVFLEKAKSDFHNIEVVIVLRILYNLGYLGINNKLNAMVRSPYEENLVLEASKSRVDILFEINKALGETQL